MNKRARGKQYEDIAASFLKENGVRILENNFRSREGEIDIIGIDGRDLVFFEVKYRKTEEYGNPAEAVGVQKQSVICAVSDFYRYLHKNLSQLQVRYDVIAFLGDEPRWFKNAFSYSGRGF